MTDIGVVGYGVVGKAVAAGFKQKGHNVFVNDSEITSDNKTKLALHCDVIFICVPTPRKPDGSADLTCVYQVAEEFSMIAESILVPPLVIKSTVPPRTTCRLNWKYPKLQFLCNPEFLRAEHALEDFLHPDRTVIGALKKHFEALGSEVEFKVADNYNTFIENTFYEK